MSKVDSAWFTRCEAKIPRLLSDLKLSHQPGRYLPCRRGPTAEGREMSLAWSCFALKIAYITGHWQNQMREEREEWIEFIQDFQRTNEEGAFEDPIEMAYLHRSPSVLASILKMVGRGPWRPEPRSILLAETKQAIATLAQVGAKPRRPFRGFPVTPSEVRSWLEALDWSKPWGAGGQGAGLVVFLATQASLFMESDEVAELLDVCRDFYSGLVDRESGAYFRGTRPAHGELINGAMKVLMALDWLDMPIHYPDRLIATTLAAHPKRDGCHLVDAIYVLHRALAGRSAETPVRNYCEDVFAALREHEQDAGGFSFYVRKAQTNYYGVPISRGLDEPDLQGTCLLIWAGAMLWQVADPSAARWKVLKP